MEHLTIFYEFVLFPAYMCIYFYYIMKAFRAAIKSFFKIASQDSIVNIIEIGLYVFVFQVSLLSTLSLSHTFSTTLIKVDDANALFTGAINLMFVIFGLVIFMTKISVNLLQASYGEYFNTVFKLSFSLICICINSGFTMLVANLIYDGQILLYEKILKVDEWHDLISILLFLYFNWSVIRGFIRQIPIICGQLRNEGNVESRTENIQ